MHRSLAIAFVSALALAAAAPAFADRDNSRVVEYGDLNLNSDPGADALINRVETASADVCGDYRGRRSAVDRMHQHHCALDTAEVAVTDVNHPHVTSRYYGYTPEIVIEDDTTYYKK